MNVYHDLFENKDDVLNQFAAPADALDGAEVLLARYSYEDYSGSAFVLYEKDGKLYEVNGGHCSCNGLEGQWEPEETSWEMLAHVVRNGRKFDGDPDMVALVDARVPMTKVEGMMRVAAAD